MTCGFGWIDDVNVLAWGKTVEEAVSAMNSIVPRLESGPTRIPTPPTPPTTPLQPRVDNDDSADRSFAAVAALPPPPPSWPRHAPIPASPKKPAAEPTTPASHLVHLYAQPNLDIQRVRQTLGMPKTIPTSRMSKGDILVRMPTASAAAHLRVVAAAAQLAPATPLWLFGVVVHGVPNRGNRRDVNRRAGEEDRRGRGALGALAAEEEERGVLWLDAGDPGE
ncbi:hypothetical protein NBRC10513_006939 [Rhodotorula toruloides]